MNFFRDITNYDLYGKSIYIKIGSSGVTSTIYSKCITKIVFAVIIIYFIEVTIQTLERKNLISKTTTKKVYHRPNIPLTLDNFNFAFAVYNSSGSIINQSEVERYYVPYFYMLHYDGSSGTRTYANIRNCTSHDFINITSDYFSYNQLDQYSCIENFTFEVFGFADEFYKKLIFKLDYCNSEDYDNCKSEQEIADSLNGGYIKFYILENDIDIDNYDNPFVSSLKFISTDNFNLNNSFPLEEVRYFKSLEVKSDQSFFLEDYQSQFSFQLANEINYYYSTPKHSPASIYFLHIWSYDKVDTTTRNYDKMWDVVSSLGGLMKIIMAFGFLLTRSYNEYEESINLIKSRNLIQTNPNPQSNIKSKIIKQNDIYHKNIGKALNNNKKISKTNIEIAALSSNRLDNSSLDSFNHKNREKLDISENSKKNEEKEDYEGEIEIEKEENIKIPQNMDFIMNFKVKKKILDISIKKPQVLSSKYLNIQMIENDNKIDIDMIQENLRKKYEKIKKEQKDFHFSFTEKLCMMVGFRRNEEKNDKNHQFCTFCALSKK